jgi:hypothetical protein
LRCYFLKDGQIVDVAILANDLSDREAAAEARSLFLARAGEVDGFEVWDDVREVVRYPIQ